MESGSDHNAANAATNADRLLDSLRAISIGANLAQAEGPVDLQVAMAAAGLFEQGRQIGLAGGQKPTGPTGILQGWIHGDTLRRIRAGEVLGFVCQGTRCTCGEQAWGWRAGCRCDDPAQTMAWGVLVDDGLADGGHAKFMTVDQVLATGLLLVNCFTGETMETVPLDSK